MRHRESGRKLNRNSSHRKALFRNMTVSLVDREMITTTVAKAKELRRVAEPLITMARNDNVAKRRLAFARLRDRAAVTKLFNELGPRYRNRPGGYLRILKLGARAGDKAPMAIVELVDRPATGISAAQEATAGKKPKAEKEEQKTAPKKAKDTVKETKEKKSKSKTAAQKKKTKK